MVTTLPRDLVLTDEQRAVIEEYILAIEVRCKQTPEDNAVWEAATLVKITELLMSPFRNARLTAIEAEVAGRQFLIALRDVPVWAVEIAIERWICGSCGNNEQGQPYDCEWRPAPAALRRVALEVKYSVSGELRPLRRLLLAEPLIEFDDDHCKQMKAKLAGLVRLARP